MLGDLTTLARVKAYLKITNTVSDGVLGQIITGVSATVLNYVNRATFGVQAFADVYDGNGKDYMLLRQWPVISVESVQCFGTVIPASPGGPNWPPQAGFMVEEAQTVGGAQQRLMLFGYCFPRQRAGVKVTYTAGYRTVDEPHTVGATPTDPDLVWISDLGVTLADGTPLTAVTTAPASGQYQVVDGQYNFNAAQVDAEVLISYSSVPPDVDLAVQQAVAEFYNRSSRIGIVSQSVAGQETVSYSQKDLGDSIKLALRSFRRVTPT